MKNKRWLVSECGWNGIKGVYCVCSISNNKNVVHYIGRSKDIGKRLSKSIHPYRILSDFCVPVFIKYKETENYIELERAMIKKLKPRLNIQLK